MRIEYHRTLIADKHRNEAFYKALEKVITPGETTVADIGAGTGLIGLMASKLGAKRVYLYEVGEVSGVAKDVLRANKARGCEVIPCHSREMIDPPKVDVVVSETLGNYAFEENIIDSLNDARDRFLNPGGIIIPGDVTQYAALVTGSRIDDELRAWSSVGHGIDMTVAERMSCNNVYVRKLESRELLNADGVAWDRCDFSKTEKANRKGEVVWRLDERRQICGLCVWWCAKLVPGVVISTGPRAPASHWEQLYFPLNTLLDVGAGEQVVAAIRSKSSEEGGTHLAWSVSHLDVNAKRITKQSMDLDQGYLP